MEKSGTGNPGNPQSSGEALGPPHDYNYNPQSPHYPPAAGGNVASGQPPVYQYDQPGNPGNPQSSDEAIGSPDGYNYKTQSSHYPPAAGGNVRSGPPPVYQYDQPNDRPVQINPMHHVPPHYGTNSSNNVQVSVTQPMPVGNTFRVTTFNDHMGLAVFTCLCCFWPLGLAAILKSSEAQQALQKNQLGLANQHSDASLCYSQISILVGVIICVLVIVISIIQAST